MDNFPKLLVEKYTEHIGREQFEERDHKCIEDIIIAATSQRNKNGSAAPLNDCFVDQKYHPQIYI